jgi:hypothetical protein
MSKTIHDIPEADRPREKLLRKGAKALSDQELLAVLLGKGTPGMELGRSAPIAVAVIATRVRRWPCWIASHFLSSAKSGVFERSVAVSSRVNQVA